MQIIDEILLKQPLLLFDGECALCNRLIRFYLKREKNKKVNFAPLKSETGQALLRYFEINHYTDSIILIKEHEAFTKSCAVIRLSRYMKGLWPVCLVFLIVPRFMRNWVYDFVGKRRVKWFGRVDSCALLKSEDQSRFMN